MAAPKSYDEVKPEQKITFGPKGNEDKETFIKEVAEKMVRELMGVQPTDEASKKKFFNIITQYEEIVFSKYRVINPENEFIREQIALLKNQYDDEMDADKFFEITEDQNYLREFQDFEKPPIVPEQVAQTEFYRPNPAAFQKRINDNPYSVDVGFSSLETPIYTKLDDFPARMNTRANSQFYNPQEHFNQRNDTQAPTKPFVQNINMKIYERGQDPQVLDEMILRAEKAQKNSMFASSSQKNLQGSNTQSQNQSNYQIYDLLRDPEAVSFLLLLAI